MVMATETAERLMTADELLALPDAGSEQYELVKGRLIRLCPASAYSSIVAGNVLIDMGTFVRQHGHGVCFGADAGFKLSSDPDTVRSPDVSFVRTEHVPEGGIPRRGYWEGAPDLAVEVLSPSNRPSEMYRRIADLLDAGTRLIWMIDPERRTATIIRSSGVNLTIDEDGVLDGEDVLPGFRLSLRDVLV
jgi:Uma2 family endonuclease